MGDAMLNRFALQLLFAVVIAFNAVPVAHGFPKNTKEKQDNCGGVHQPGDLLTCYVTFEGKPEFTSLEIVFNLPREDKPRQHGSFINFILRDTMKVGPQTYAVSGVLPDCVPGAYILAAVSAHTPHDWKQYGNLGELNVLIVNDSGPPQRMDLANKQQQAFTRQSPEIVQTTPPDPDIFPRIKEIRAASRITPPPEDLVHLIRNLFTRPDRCGGLHNQGDMLACRITFVGDPQLRTVTLAFMRDEKQTSQYQNQLCRGFVLGTQGQAPREDDGTYEVTTTIPKCGSGKYRMVAVGAFGYSGTDDTKLYYKNYANGTDFRSRIELRLKDTAHNTFPAIVVVSQTPPRP
jgi:hypothetical protein